MSMLGKYKKARTHRRKCRVVYRNVRKSSFLVSSEERDFPTKFDRRHRTTNGSERIHGYHGGEQSYFRTFIAAGEYNILQSQAVTLAESKLELEKTVIGLRKEIVDTRDAYLETERGSRVLLDESRKENESVSWTIRYMRLRFLIQYRVNRSEEMAFIDDHLDT